MTHSPACWLMPTARCCALMDKYHVTYEGLESPIVVFVNNYDQGVTKPVAGFLLP